MVFDYVASVEFSCNGSLPYPEPKICSVGGDTPFTDFMVSEYGTITGMYYLNSLVFSFIKKLTRDGSYWCPIRFVHHNISINV
jgi:hypothetical protein